MTKEEILEKSRRENKNMDEREQTVMIKAGDQAGIISFMLCSLLVILNSMAGGPSVVQDALWAVIWCKYGIEYGYKAFHLKKRPYWGMAVFSAAACIISLLRFLIATFGWQ